MKALYGPQSSGTSSLLSFDGSTLVTEKTAILQRWAEHFHSVLNRPSAISEAALANLPEIEVNTLLADPPSLTEVNQAVPKMASGKAPGADFIPAQVFNFGGPQFTAKLHELFLIM